MVAGCLAQAITVCLQSLALFKCKAKICMRWTYHIYKAHRGRLGRPSMQIEWVFCIHSRLNSIYSWQQTHFLAMSFTAPTSFSIHQCIPLIAQICLESSPWSETTWCLHISALNDHYAMKLPKTGCRKSHIVFFLCADIRPTPLILDMRDVSAEHPGCCWSAI